MSSPQDREAALFALAIEKPVAERAAFIKAVCGSDDVLHQRLEALLAAHEHPNQALAAAGPGGAATVKLDFIHEANGEAVGQMIGRYKLLEKVGEGGCGVVYVAEQTEPVRRRVALKVIKLGMDSRQVVARFEAERQALAMMDHPNIAKVLDAGTTAVGRPYFVMELVRGIRITDYCDQNHLSTQERVDLFIKVCHAIQHAHQKGIIHRDIKPSNILVTLHDSVPVPKVIDFGIAKATEGRLTDATVYTQLHQFIGTPAYMSPEQAEMSGLDIDTRGDIYSLGVLLYEMLTGKTPFDGRELMAQGIDAMRKTIREKEPARPSTKIATLRGEELTTTAKRRSADAAKLLHQLRGDLDWIVMKCLEKDRTRRYETANGLAADLKRHLNNEPVVARPPSAAYRFHKAFRRNKLAFTAAFAVAAALVIGTGISTWQTFTARRAQREAEAARQAEQLHRLAADSAKRIAETEQQRADLQARKAIESQEQSRRLLYATDMNLAQQSLQQDNLGKARRLLDRHRPQPGQEDLRGWEWRYLWQLTRNGALVTLTNRPTRGFSVSFSPDGTRLAVGWYDGVVELWDVSGRRMIRTLTGRRNLPAGRVTFSRNGNLLAATSESRGVTVYDVDAGTESVVWRTPDPRAWDVRDVAFSPDSSKLIIYAGASQTNSKAGDGVWVVDVSSSTIDARHATDYSEDDHFGAAQISPDNRRLYLARSDYRNYRYSIQSIDLTTGREHWRTERERDQGLTTMALSPDGRVLVSGSGYADPTIRVWDAATGRVVARLSGHTGWVAKLTFSPDGKRLISAAGDQTIRIWDTTTWTETRVLRGHTDEIHGVAISESAHLIASASKDGDLMLWRDSGEGVTEGYRTLPETLGRDDLVRLDHSRVLLLPPGEWPLVLDVTRDSYAAVLPELGLSTNFLVRFANDTLCHWDGTNQIIVRKLRGTECIPSGAIRLDSGLRPGSLAYNATRHLVAWIQSPASVFMASPSAPGRRIELKSDAARLSGLYFSDDGNHLAAYSRLGNVLRVWNVDTGKIVVSLGEGSRQSIFSADGRVLIAAMAQNHGHEILFHDLTQPTRAPRRVPGKYFSASLAVSHDGLLASATGGGEVRLFDPAKGGLIETVHGHRNAIFGLDFSPDGRRLISASGGREAVKLWDVGTRQELLTLSGIGSSLQSARWTADGNAILAGVPWQAWRAPSWEEIAAAEAKTGPDRE